MQCASQADEESWMIVAPQRNIRTFTDASVGPNSFDEPGIELSQVEGSVSLGVVTSQLGLRIVSYLWYANRNGRRTSFCGM